MDSQLGELVELVKEGVRRTSSALAQTLPGQSVRGYALLTDDSLWTCTYAAVTDEWLRAQSDPELLWQPTEWPYSPDDDALLPANDWMRRRAEAPPAPSSDSNPSARSSTEEISNVFGAMVTALAELRAEGGLWGSGVFLTVLSTDPSPHFEELEAEAVAKLNVADVVKRRAAYLARFDPRRFYVRHLALDDSERARGFTFQVKVIDARGLASEFAYFAAATREVEIDGQIVPAAVLQAASSCAPGEGHFVDVRGERTVARW